MWESNLFSAIVGAVIGILAAVIGETVAYNYTRREQSRNVVKDFILANPDIFNNVFRASVNSTINEVQLRNSVTQNPNIYFILPEKLRRNFIELYLLYQCAPKEYDKQIPKIKDQLRVIYSEIISYGYDIFDTNMTKE